MQSFPILFRLTTGRTLQAAGIAVVACRNNEGAILLAGHLVKHGRSVAFVVDGDTIKQRFYNEGRLAGVGLKKNEHVHLVGQPDKELECIFTDEQWAEAANKCWPRIEGCWSPEDIHEHREGKFSARLEEMFRAGSAEGPSGKPAMMFGLACTLQSADEVPQPVREIFLKLVAMAALDE